MTKKREISRAGAGEVEVERVVERVVVPVWVEEEEEDPPEEVDETEVDDEAEVVETEVDEAEVDEPVPEEAVVVGIGPVVTMGGEEQESVVNCFKVDWKVRVTKEPTEEENGKLHKICWPASEVRRRKTVEPVVIPTPELMKRAAAPRTIWVQAAFWLVRNSTVDTEVVKWQGTICAVSGPLASR